MKYTASLCTLFIIALSSYTVHGMVTYKPLGPIEKEILLREVNRIGKQAAIQQIQATPEPKYTSHRFGIECAACFNITTRVNPHAQDTFSRLVMQKITKKEEKKGYIPETITKEKLGGISMTMPNNDLEKNTKYYHKENKNGAYIKLVSNFFDKQGLLAILENQ